MFLATEATRTFTALEFLLAVLFGLAPVAVTLLVKLVLYRRRIAEDNEEAIRSRRQREIHQAMERLRRRHASMASSTCPLGFAAANRASRDREREKRKRFNGATAETNGPQFDDQESRLVSSTRCIATQKLAETNL